MSDLGETPGRSSGAETSSGAKAPNELPNHLEVARGGGMVIVRVVGVGNLNTAPVMCDFVEAQRASGYQRLVLDLSQCCALDSTFMGSLVGLAQVAKQYSAYPAPAGGGPAPGQGADLEELTPEQAVALLTRELSGSTAPLPAPPPGQTAIWQPGFVVLVNVSPECREPLKILGVDRFVQIAGRVDLSALEMAVLPQKQMAADERAQMILRVHRNLAEIDKRNEARFGAFLKTLSRELAKAK